MGCCLPKSFTSKKDTEQSFILLQDNEKINESSEMTSDFDINRGLCMFGQDKFQRNFMLTFDFDKKMFRKMSLQKKGRVTSAFNSVLQLLGVHHQGQRHAHRLRGNRLEFEDD